MLKLIVFIISLFTIGYLIINDNMLITITGFGYEITISSILLLALVILFFYFIHLLKKPLVWCGIIRQKITTAQFVKREKYLTNLIKTLLENDKQALNQLLKQKKGLFHKADNKHLLIQALISPENTVFEEMSKNPETELAGLHGLFAIAQKQGNLKEQERILNIAFEKNPKLHWVIENRFHLAILQNEWERALKLLEEVKNNKLIDKEDYTKAKAGILFKLNKPTEAFALDNTSPTFAVEAAKENPKKAINILLEAWQKTPAKEIYQAYMHLFQNETATKQMKALKKLIAHNPTTREALLAQAETAIRLELWREAKETMQVYMATYPLTKEAAHLMATVIREGWHHEEEALEWEQKAIETEEQSGWACSKCNQKALNWDILCPNCNAFNTLFYRP